MNAPKSRINMRISEENLAIIKNAAEENGQDMTSFVLGAALDRARAVVLQAHVTRLSASEAERFEAMLEREPREIPALRELLDSARQVEYHVRDQARTQ
ncbi:DUF1778 domain-containing protein [Demequina sp. TTPB684]|uniref:type II toxin-antitoxin system TacA family antitoxin n=1 Tax=unclassified Demequina TaxID=2620311 RepID=UPI001CF3ECE2|nr:MULTISPECIES: DUF1778 domain-containing protein [unclassified Demequina]MCB2413069.1 DUF1778 domain-containing protein [Demequina sp. TTPB684]UPU88123.1 DUF1778 domain-containing protein [Demequina sp. TMPB413]